MTTATPPGIDAERLGHYFVRTIEGGDADLTFELLAGGRSNLTYLVMGGGQEWVLRRPPLGLVLPSAHDMAREFTVLQALAQTSFPVARPLHLCTDDTVLGVPFYLMERKRGRVFFDRLDDDYATTKAERRAMSLAAVQALVDLHALDYESLGLAGFGRPAGYVERQVRRWADQWQRSKTRDLPEIDEVGRRLAAAIPASSRSAIVHGDYRLGNVMFHPDDPGSVSAVFDWEMATLGDPLADLGYLIKGWGEPGDPAERFEATEVGRLTALEGFITRAEIAEEYERRSGHDASGVSFFECLGFYKAAVVTEGIYARHLQGLTVGEGYDHYGHRVELMAELALEASAEIGARLG